MRNSIFLSVFMLVGLFTTGQLLAQDSQACSKKVKSEACVKAAAACSSAAESSTASATAPAQPLVVQAAMKTSPVKAKPACKPANGTHAAAVANCDPSLCKNLTCDPNDCPPECRKHCGKAASVAEAQSVDQPACQGKDEKAAKVAVAKGL